VLAEQTEDVIVLLVGEGLAERLDVLQKTLDGSGEGKLVLFLDPREFKSAARRFNFKTLAFLRFESIGRSDAGSGAPAQTVLPPLNDVTTGTGAPLNPAPRIALERDVPPAASGLHLFEDIDTCHRAPPLVERTLLWTLRETRVNNYFVFMSMLQPDL